MSESVLVLGGGLTGLRATVEVAAAGCRAILVEQRPILGGKRAAQLFGPDCPDPRLAEIADNPAIACHNLARLVSLTGDAGNFTATVQAQPQYVTQDCTRCNHCVPVCPQIVSNEYDAGLTFRKAIHSPLPRTVPDIYSIDIDSCLNSPPNYLPCEHCVVACDDDAIHFDTPVPEPVEYPVAAVIVATGFADTSEAERDILEEFGYGTHPDIVSGSEMQRMLEDPGPSGGYAVRPSDENYPDSVLLVLTAVTAEAVWVLCNHLRRLAQQEIGALSVLVLSAGDDESAIELQDTARACHVDLRHGSWVTCDTGEGGLQTITVTELPRGGKVELSAELVALYTDVQPDPETANLAATLGLERNEQGYLATRPGIFLAGGVEGTVGVESGGQAALTAVEGALQHVVKDEAATAESQTNPEAQVSTLRREELEKLLYALMKLGEGSAG